MRAQARRLRGEIVVGMLELDPHGNPRNRWTIAFLYRTFATSDVSVRRLRTIFPEGSDMVDLDGPIFGEGPPSWSPDRRLILYDKVSDNGGVIYRVMNFSIRMSYPLKTDSLVVNAGN